MKNTRQTPAALHKGKQAVTAKTLLQMIRQAESSAILRTITKLHIQQIQIRTSQAKLKDKAHKVKDAIRKATTQDKPEQFLFRF